MLAQQSNPIVGCETQLVCANNDEQVDGGASIQCEHIIDIPLSNQEQQPFREPNPEPRSTSTMEIILNALKCLTALFLCIYRVCEDK